MIQKGGLSYFQVGGDVPAAPAADAQTDTTTQTNPVANLPMAGYIHTGVGNALLRTSYPSAGQVQDGALTYLTPVSGTDTITATAPITLNTTDFALGVSVVSNSRITVDYAGLYNLQFSLQFVNPDNQQHDVDVWFRKNGVDIDNSNSQFTVPVRKNATIYGHLIAALNYFVDLDAGDYVELVWATSSTLVTVEQIPAQTSPTRPATPSAIVTMQYVSSNGYTTDIFSEPYISSQTKGSAVISHPANTLTNKVYRYIIVA